jgi:hypothetical protein
MREGFNAKLIINNVGLLAGYYLPVTQWANLTGQIGFSHFTQISKAFPVKIYEPDPNQDDVMYLDYTVLSAAFPVKFSIGFTPLKQLNIGFAKNIEFGYACGFYIEPDFGFFTGVYHGPQLSVTF